MYFDHIYHQSSSRLPQHVLLPPSCPLPLKKITRSTISTMTKPDPSLALLPATINCP